MNSSFIVLYEKTALRFDFGPRKVPQPENMHFHFHALSGWGTFQGQKLNQTKAMIVNFTEKYNFHKRLQLKGENVEIVEKMKILGTVVTNQMSWDKNCSILV